jgi:hypothetical protein
MGNINRTFALILIGVIAISSLGLLAIQSVNAQSPIVLPIPKFTAYFVGQSYNVPATISVDPYTGENITVPSHFVTKGYIYLVVTNDERYNFIPLNNPKIQFDSKYNFRLKGHFEADNWTDAGEASVGGTSYGNNGTFVMDSHAITYYSADNYPTNAQIDFQIKVSVANNTWVPNNPNYPNTDYHQISSLYATSDWSSTQTVTITNSTASPPQGYGGPEGYWGPPPVLSTVTSSPTISATPTATIPELSWLMIVPLLLSVFAVAVIVRHRKVKHD